MQECAGEKLVEISETLKAKYESKINEFVEKNHQQKAVHKKKIKQFENINESLRRKIFTNSKDYITNIDLRDRKINAFAKEIKTLHSKLAKKNEQLNDLYYQG